MVSEGRVSSICFLAFLLTNDIPCKRDNEFSCRTIVTPDALYLGIRYKKHRSTSIEVMAALGSRLQKSMEEVQLLFKHEVMSRVFREQFVREHKERKASLQSWLTPLNENWDSMLIKP